MLPDDVSRAESRGDGRAGLLTGMLWSGPRGTQGSSECVEGRGGGRAGTQACPKWQGSGVCFLVVAQRGGKTREEGICGLSPGV